MRTDTPALAGLPRRRFLQQLGGLTALTVPLAPVWAQEAAAPSSAVRDLWWLDRLTWGATPQALTELQQSGRSAWLTRQLAAPASDALPEAAAREVAAMDISSLSLMMRMRKLDALRPEAGTAPAPAVRAEPGATLTPTQQARREYLGYLRQLTDETQRRALLRAAYAPGQLREQLVWFWMNHFSVDGRSGLLRAWLPDYEDRAIRRYATGRFRDLLGAVVTHPAMLIYLNNNQNAAGRINENLARELMELHTLGVDGGYTQGDVESLARVLTGLGVNFARARAETPDRPPMGRVEFVEGFAVYQPLRHVQGAKTLLGQTLPGDGWDEIQAMLDLLARHPSTARHVSRQMARHFVGENPPPALLARMARVFQDTDGQITEVVKAMVSAPEFEASLDRRFKLPVQYLVSAWRLLWPDATDAPQTRRAQAWLERLGQPMYARRTPDGYPADASYWNGSGQMSSRFELARMWSGMAMMPAAGEATKAGAPADPRQAQALVDWLMPTLGERTRETLATASNPRERLTWLLSSPEFMTR